MENQNLNTEEVVTETTTPEVAPRKKVYKDQDFYPVYAIIMCVCAAVGQLISPEMGIGIGMGVGVIISIIISKKGIKQIDTSPTKARKKKEK